jgi:hypothetical protein
MAKKNEEAGPNPGTQIVNIEEQLKRQLAGLQNRVGAPPSNKIATKGKVFTLPDGKTGTELQVIIGDWRHVLAHYPGVYNANNPQDPDCFAVGSFNPDSGQLVAHANIAKPHGENCKVCPKNQWKSAATGRGKACKNQIRLMVFAAADILEGKEVQPMTLYISPTGLKGFNAYVTDLASYHQLDLMQVVTHVSFDPNETYPSLVFKMLDKHAQVNQVWALRQRHQEVVDRPIEFRNAAKAA